jgi:hypothetical protein
MLSYELRNNDRMLHLYKQPTNFLERSFSYRGAVSWNSLQHNLQIREPRYRIVQRLVEYEHHDNQDSNALDHYYY